MSWITDAAGIDCYRWLTLMSKHLEVGGNNYFLGKVRLLAFENQMPARTTANIAADL